MGYELLDESGSKRRVQSFAPVGTAMPPEVLSLDELPEPAQHAPRPPRIRLPRTAKRDGTRHRWSPWVTAVTTIVALVAGVVGGAIWNQRRHDAAERRAVDVQAFGQVVNVSDDSAGITADVTVRVHNGGRAPVWVEPSHPIGLAAPGTNVVLLDKRTALAPDGDTTVSMRVTFDCSAAATSRPHLTVSDVRGTKRDVTVLDQTFAPLAVAGDVCQPQSDAPAMDLSVEGTATAPVLVATNSSARDGVLTASPGVEPHGFTWSLKPALPIALPSGATKKLRLTLDVPKCLPASEVSGAGYVEFLSTGPDGGTLVTGVDLSTVLGATWQRTCQR